MIHTSTTFAITASTSPALGPTVRRFSAWSARWRSVRTARAGRTSAAELEGLYFVAVCGNAVVAMLNTRTTIIALTEKRRVIFFPCRLLRLVETYPCMYSQGPHLRPPTTDIEESHSRPVQILLSFWSLVRAPSRSPRTPFPGT